MKDLPVDVLSKIDSEKIGDPKYLKVKYSEALKRIQHKKIYIIEYCVMRGGVPFSLKSIEDIITEEKEELSLI